MHRDRESHTNPKLKFVFTVKRNFLAHIIMKHACNNFKWTPNTLTLTAWMQKWPLHTEHIVCPLFVFVRVWECAFVKMHKWKCSRARDRCDGFHTFYVHLHAYKINSSRFTHGMEWNGCMRFVDTKQLFQACNNNSNKREESEREREQQQKKIFILANNDVGLLKWWWNSFGVWKTEWQICERKNAGWPK